MNTERIAYFLVGCTYPIWFAAIVYFWPELRLLHERRRRQELPPVPLDQGPQALNALCAQISQNQEFKNTLSHQLAKIPDFVQNLAQHAIKDPGFVDALSPQVYKSLPRPPSLLQDPEALKALSVQVALDQQFLKSVFEQITQDRGVLEKMKQWVKAYILVRRESSSQNGSHRNHAPDESGNSSQPQRERGATQESSNTLQRESSEPQQQKSLIMRTLFRQPIKGLMQHPTYERDLGEEEYDNYRDSTSSSAIELTKDVKIIPPGLSKQNTFKSGQGNNGEDIIDHIVSEKMIIRSPELIKIIKEVVSYWPSAAFYENQTKLVLDRPYRSLGVYRVEFGTKLKEYEAKLKQTEMGTNDQETLDLKVKELKQLLAEVDKVQGAFVNAEVERNQGSPIEPPRATFDMLWMLYKPGDSVYVSTNEFTGVCRLRLSVWGRGRSSGPSIGTEDPYASVTLHLWYWDHHDSNNLSRRQHTVSIERFQKEKAILELPVYPMKYATNKIQLEAECAKRGRAYCDYIKRGFSHCKYNGHVSKHASNPWLQHQHTLFRGKLIIDPERYYEEKGGVEGAKWLSDSDISHGANSVEGYSEISGPLNPASKLEHRNEDYILIPKWIRAFTIGTRGIGEWVWVNIDKVCPYKNDQSLIKTIGFPAEDLEQIQALTYRSDKLAADQEHLSDIVKADYIEEKGEGRLILLHGPPGLGKTYTVECAAEWADRPLLRLTCAELGLNPTNLERNLNKNLRRAERWKALVLIDEADIFLEKRLQHGPLEKEAILAVFLRALEYFSGIMCLTTNRVASFDPAVLDRMLLVLGYSYPNEDMKKKIRGNCLRRLEADGRFELSQEAKMAYCTMKDRDAAEVLNGTNIPGRENDTSEPRTPNTAEISSDGYPWSGREIVSVLKHAAILAQWGRANTNAVFDDPDAKIMIKWEHICMAVQKVRDLDRYLSDHTHDSKEERARPT